MTKQTNKIIEIGFNIQIQKEDNDYIIINKELQK